SGLARAVRKTQSIGGWLDQSARKWIVDGQRRHTDRLGDVGRRRIANLAPVGRPDRRIIPRRIEQAVSAAQHGLVVDTVEDAGSRRGIDRRLMPLPLRRAVLAGKDQPAIDRATL